MLEYIVAYEPRAELYINEDVGLLPLHEDKGPLTWECVDSGDIEDTLGSKRH